jgi:hypothetical protein
MARLFVTPRELDFINDTVKELIKDVSGQKIYYYCVRPEFTNIHSVYEEAVDKIFDPPIEIECRIEYKPADVRINKFGVEEFYTIEAYFHARDLIERDIEIKEGDFFNFDATWFEVVKSTVNSIIHGQIEHSMGVHVVCKQARRGLIDIEPLGPTNEQWTDENAVQDTFVQQRGLAKNSLGETGDVRNLQQKGVLDPPISGPAEILPDGKSPAGISSSFYDET